MFGLASGSFINAFVYRFHEKKNWLTGRSECVYCHKQIKNYDLIPVISFLILRGKCRNCHKNISWQYPVVELLVGILFVVSYIYWPLTFTTFSVVSFIVWLIILVILVILAIYDLKWLILPNKIVLVFSILAFIWALNNILFIDNNIPSAILDLLLGVLLAGGLFYVLFIFSKGQWIGGGDVKLGFALGLLAGSLGKAFLIIFLSSLIGSLISIVLVIFGKLTIKKVVPYGPFLITATFIVVLWGTNILNWYKNLIN